MTTGNEATDIKVEQALLDLSDLKSEAINSLAKAHSGSATKTSYANMTGGFQGG